MKKQLRTAVLLLVPTLALADTLVMKNGNQMRGTFNSANSNQITFTDNNGNRQSVNLFDVQELRFGNAGNDNSSNDSGFGRNSNGNRGFANDSNGGNRNQVPASAGLADDLERLQSDLQRAMDNNNVSGDQRQSLDDSKSTLQSAAQQARNGRQVNQRNIRLALDSIRNASSRMQRQDRDNLDEDIRRVSASVSGTGGRDY